ncbi:MAG: restriction endonuclease [Sphingomonadaceae bacterium]
MTMWMVRAGQGGRFAEEARSRKIVGLGWEGLGDPNVFQSKSDLIVGLRVAYPEYSDGTAASAANQLWRFKTELKVGDSVITYDSGARHYLFGEIASDAIFLPNDVEEFSFQRSVKWSDNPISRDILSDDARNRLGSVLTLFKVPSEIEREMIALAKGVILKPKDILSMAEEIVDPYAKIDELAVLKIADRISALDWQTMQRLVAALLRAMGYKTVISPDGPDRGKDILASPDGFGFEHPRIVVEVKHRRGQMGAPEIRSFIGGRHKDDRGLYVSTGGFSREAHYEAERSNIAVKLMSLDDLARAAIEYYEHFDSEGKAILPLTRLYWPA